MKTSLALKTTGGILGLIAAWMFPTDLLRVMFYCLIALTALDCITGVAAAIEQKIPVTPHAFVSKAGKKLIRGMAYMGLALIFGELIRAGFDLKVPFTEPFGTVLGVLIGAESVSVLRNMSTANINIPILDKLFDRLMSNFNEQVTDANTISDKRIRGKQ